MPLGSLSLLRLDSCDVRIQRFVRAVADGVDAGECPGVADITVLCGWRNAIDQDEAFRKKTSKLKWPESKHNNMSQGLPNSLAVDMAPYPIDWSTAGLPRFRALRKYALKKAEEMGIKIRIISWDWPHYELL